MLLAGWVTDYIGIYMVFGGFMLGLAMPRSSPLFGGLLQQGMLDVTSVLLLSVFFAFSGLNTRLNGLAGTARIVPFLVIPVAGFSGKCVGCAAAMRAFGSSWREASAVASLMNARGLIILIFINVGLASGIISQTVFYMLVLVAIITTASAMPMYRWSMPAHAESELGQGDSAGADRQYGERVMP